MNICVGVLFFLLWVCFIFFFFGIVLVWVVKVLFLCELVSVDRFMYYPMLVFLRKSVAWFVIHVLSYVGFSYPFCLNLIRVGLLCSLLFHLW